MRVAVLGATGMLGHAVVREFSHFGYDVITVGRESCDLEFDVYRHRVEHLELGSVDFVVNCIGLISHLIRDDSVKTKEEAILLNSLFPYELATMAEQRGINVIQIATDCVFSGSTGSYVETCNHDAVDLYGRTKSLGEVRSPNVMNLRASIIGRESRGFHSLIEWVLKQPFDSQIPGFTDRMWNGVSTKAFARVVIGVIEKGLFEPGLQHLVPSNILSKAELVRHIAFRFGRVDLVVNDVKSDSPKDMTLSTLNPEKNRVMWNAGGYVEIPTIQQMVDDISV